MLQKWQENTCARVSLHVLGMNFIKKESQA